MSEPRHSAGPAEDDYKPVFSETVRTAVYVLGLALVIIGTGVSTFGDPAIGDYITTSGGLIAAGFGVAYNPIRMGKIVS